MGKVLFGEKAQTVLAADMYANESQMVVNGTACFPVIQPNSGDFFYVYAVRPATNCSGVYREVLKVVETVGNIWQTERVDNQCARSNVDFRMGDMVYHEPGLRQALEFMRNSIQSNSNNVFVFGQDVMGANDDRLVLVPVDNEIHTFTLPIKPPNGTRMAVLKTRNGAGNSGYNINAQGATVNYVQATVWDNPDYSWIHFVYEAAGNNWFASIGV